MAPSREFHLCGQRPDVELRVHLVEGGGHVSHSIPRRHTRFAGFGHRKVMPRACVTDSKKHLRTFLSDALEDLGFITSECGKAGELAGVLDAQAARPLRLRRVSRRDRGRQHSRDLVVRKDFNGKVLVIGQPDSIVVKAVRQIGEEYGIAMLPSAADAVQRRDAARERGERYCPQSRLRVPAVDVAEALKAGWLELWYQQKINVRTLVPSGAEALVRMRHPAWGVVPPAYFIRDDKDPHFRSLSEFVIGRAIEDWRYLARTAGSGRSLDQHAGFVSRRSSERYAICAVRCPTIRHSAAC